MLHCFAICRFHKATTRDDAPQGCRDKISRNRCGPTCVSRDQIFQTLRLCRLGWLNCSLPRFALRLGSVTLHRFLAISNVLYIIELADPTRVRLKTTMKLGGVLGFFAGFMFAYQRSSSKFVILSSSICRRT